MQCQINTEKKWKIVLGREGTHSYISKNDIIKVEKIHDKIEYQSLLSKFYFYIADGLIRVKNLMNDQIFLQFNDKDIIKQEFTSLKISRRNTIEKSLQVCKFCDDFISLDIIA